MKYEGKVSVSRYSSNQHPYFGISIELEDKNTGAQVVSVDLTPEQFGNVLSGLGHVDCLFDLGNTNLVGKKRESQTVSIPLKKSPFQLDDNDISELLEIYEVDGWKARVSDFKNSHKFGKDSVNVVFVRFVDETVEVE